MISPVLVNPFTGWVRIPGRIIILIERIGSISQLLAVTIIVPIGVPGILVGIGIADIDYLQGAVDTSHLQLIFAVCAGIDVAAADDQVGETVSHLDAPGHTGSQFGVHVGDGTGINNPIPLRIPVPLDLVVIVGHQELVHAESAVEKAVGKQGGGAVRVGNHDVGETEIARRRPADNLAGTDPADVGKRCSVKSHDRVAVESGADNLDQSAAVHQS